MLRRGIERSLRRSLTDTPVVVLTGARQAGKSTLAQTVVPDERYFTLDDATILAAAQADPTAFIGRHDETVVIDEVQRTPGLFLAITNDPWMGTGHLSDVCLVKPIFRGGRLIAFSSTTSHMPDIGGRIRAIEAREVFEEGFHVPLAKLMHAGRPDDTLIQLLRANVRTPDQTVGDIWAQVSANELMESRVLGLMENYRLDSLGGLGDELFARSERAMRQAIGAVPDGTYGYAFSTDGTDGPLDFKIALTTR